MMTLSETGYNLRAWKKNLQDQVYDAFGLTVTVSHYPPGCSKWNPVEAHAITSGTGLVPALRSSRTHGRSRTVTVRSNRSGMKWHDLTSNNVAPGVR
jgi:Rhodopirellula transposase DDE domain